MSCGSDADAPSYSDSFEAEEEPKYSDTFEEEPKYSDSFEAEEPKYSDTFEATASGRRAAEEEKEEAVDFEFSDQGRLVRVYRPGRPARDRTEAGSPESTPRLPEAAAESGDSSESSASYLPARLLSVRDLDAEDRSPADENRRLRRLGTRVRRRTRRLDEGGGREQQQQQQQQQQHQREPADRRQLESDAGQLLERLRRRRYDAASPPASAPAGDRRRPAPSLLVESLKLRNARLQAQLLLDCPVHDVADCPDCRGQQRRLLEAGANRRLVAMATGNTVRHRLASCHPAEVYGREMLRVAELAATVSGRLRQLGLLPAAGPVS